MKSSNGSNWFPLYRVVLLDDNDHTYDYVIEMLQKIFIFSLDQAYRHAEEVDRAGRTVLITCELARGRICPRPDPRLRTGLAASALQRLHARHHRTRSLIRIGAP